VGAHRGMAGEDGGDAGSMWRTSAVRHGVLVRLAELQAPMQTRPSAASQTEVVGSGVGRRKQGYRIG
jgi:hypothetical protein